MASSKFVSVAFRLIFFLVVLFNYIFTIIYLWIPKTLENFKNIFFLLYYHILFTMILWTVYATAKSDPGQVPLYWGFYIGDPDSKRTRYCLMCNVFKPTRCHHCSMCNRCVLNMDHHCPWINSCIGFYNRKFFIQMIFYLLITIFSSLIANGYSAYEIVLSIINDLKVNYDFVLKCLFILVYGIDIVMGFILSQFFKFHLKLILENKTTIETLDHKGAEFKSKYDKGYWNNWIEVMGVTKWLWFIPLKIYQGKPKGNGIDWGNNEEFLASSDKGDINNNNINNNNLIDDGQGVELAEKLNEDKDKSGISSIRNNDVTGLSELTKNHHGSMSSLYQ